jgi:hypothetical protein
VLAKYEVDSNGMENIPSFELQTHEVPESDNYMAEILVRLNNYGTLQPDSLEAMRNEYVVAILHIAINITRDVTSKHFSMRPEYEIIGNENSGRVDYAINNGYFFLDISCDRAHLRNLVLFTRFLHSRVYSYYTFIPGNRESYLRHGR